jgi:Zn finger protein HypA/HybF involved in hydrogenase expression
MWLIQDNGQLQGYAFQCPKCEYKTLNDQQYYCPTCQIQLDEVRIGD